VRGQNFTVSASGTLGTNRHMRLFVSAFGFAVLFLSLY